MALLVTDPVCFGRTADGDLEIPLRLAAGLEAVAIGVRSRLLLFAGEWFLDLAAGVPYLPGLGVDERAALLGQRYDALRTRAAFRREILATPGVVALTALQTSFDGPSRRLSVSWRARCAFGELVDQIEVTA